MRNKIYFHHTIVLCGLVASTPLPAVAQDQSPAARGQPPAVDQPAARDQAPAARDQAPTVGAPAAPGRRPSHPRPALGTPAPLAPDTRNATGERPTGRSRSGFEAEAALDASPDDIDADHENEGIIGSFLSSTKIYGVIDAYWEKVAQTPAAINAAGTTVRESNPHEFDIPNLSLMVQGSIAQRYSFFVTFAAPGANSLTVRSAWVQVALYRELLNIRAGKTYRRFGLYNEVLDAVPTYMGIEPPELFDKDHLMLTRTTNLMLHGRWHFFGDHCLSYALTTGNDERAGDEVPLGGDLRYEYADAVVPGSSFYLTNGAAAPSRSVGEGSPEGAVPTWMEEDEIRVTGGYLQLQHAGLQLQTALWLAHHTAKRDPEQILKLVDTGLNDRQRRRFGIDGPAPTASDVVIDTRYHVLTIYARLGYTIDFDVGALTPYLQYDFYRNPEAIANKALGGDNEAGLSDDGRFHKATWGVVFRPLPDVALKVDGSTHTQRFNGRLETYAEIRASLSYLWRL